MVKIFECYLIPKKSYNTLSKGAIFFGQPSSLRSTLVLHSLSICYYKQIHYFGKFLLQSYRPAWQKNDFHQLITLKLF